MLVLYSVLLIVFWLLAPTLLASFIRPQRPLGREGFAALIGIAFWLVLAVVRIPIHLHAQPWHSPWLLLLLIVALVVYAYFFLRGLTRPPQGYRPAGLRGDFLTIGVLSPIDEELLFRGILFALALPALGPFLSVLYTAVLFLLAHEVGRIGGLRRTRQELLADLAFGIIAGGFYVWTGTILAPILAHVAVNGWHAYTRPLQEAQL